MGRPKIRTDRPTRKFLTKEEHAAQPLTVPCACGCGTMLPALNRSGLPSVWAVGHHMRGNKPNAKIRQTLSDAVAASWDARKGPHEGPRRRFMTKERYEAQPLTVPCACGCGTLLPPLNKLGNPSTFVKGHGRRGTKHTDASKQKMSQVRKARNEERRGDTPAKYWGRFEDPRYRALRNEVLTRDNFTCVVCGMVGRRDGTGVYVDHILEWATHESERYNPANCQTLCYKCHCDRHGWKVAKHGNISPPQPCACGCGELTKPGRTYINGHGRRGRTTSAETIEKIRQAMEGIDSHTGQPAKHHVSRLCACGCGRMTEKGHLYAPGCKQAPRGAAIPGTLSEESRTKLRQPRSEASRAKMRKPKSAAHRAALSIAARRQWAERKGLEPPQE
jgi:5-methylcytosine-specific restriction enzyme A